MLGVAAAEEEEAAADFLAGGVLCRAFAQKAAQRGDTGAWADQDHRQTRIGGRCEDWVWPAHIAEQGVAGLQIHEVGAGKTAILTDTGPGGCCKGANGEGGLMWIVARG